MKQFISLVMAFVAFACTQEPTIRVTVTNPSALERSGEIIELSADALDRLQGQSFIIADANGKEIPYQLTYDNKLIFPVEVNANATTSYTIQPGTPQEVATITCGKHYPERVDDIAWENERIAFRTYGPALQASGEQAYGYDIWVKRVAEPIVDLRYKTELNPETKAKIAELRKTDPKAAGELANATSYHIDHGNGLDYYKVGPTLGAGTSALLADGKIVYPYCYNEYEILDNGPLRFTVKLVYNPLKVGEQENIIETRLLSLDAGSQLNKITVSFSNLNAPTPLATGIILHEPSKEYQADAAKGYMAYADPIDATNGQIYVGTVFPTKPTSIHESEEHLLATTSYQPGSSYTYYAGAGWSKWGFATPQDWYNYIQTFAQKVKEPLKVEIK